MWYFSHGFFIYFSAICHQHVFASTHTTIFVFAVLSFFIVLIFSFLIKDDICIDPVECQFTFFQTHKSQTLISFQILTVRSFNACLSVVFTYGQEVLYSLSHTQMFFWFMAISVGFSIKICWYETWRGNFCVTVKTMAHAIVKAHLFVIRC